MFEGGWGQSCRIIGSLIRSSFSRANGDRFTPASSRIYTPPAADACFHHLPLVDVVSCHRIVGCASPELLVTISIRTLTALFFFCQVRTNLSNAAMASKMQPTTDMEKEVEMLLTAGGATEAGLAEQEMEELKPKVSSRPITEADWCFADKYGGIVPKLRFG